MTDKKPGLLFVINELAPGGAEMFILRLAIYLKNDFSINILTLVPENNDEEFISMMKEEIEFYHFPYPMEEPHKITDWAFWKANALLFYFGRKGTYVKLRERHRRRIMRHLLKDRNIKIINSSSRMADNFSVSYLKLHFKIPVVITMHSGYNSENWPEGEVDRMNYFNAVNIVFDNADKIFYTADHNLTIFKSLKLNTGSVPEKLYLGYTPNEKVRSLRKELKIPENAFVCTMMARGIREKGWSEAIEAFKILKQRFPESYFIAVSTQTDYIRNLLRENSDVQGIIFTGYVPDPSNILFSSDCCLLPSAYPESLPYAIIESLAYAKPVLATDKGEISKMLNYNNEIAGAIVPFSESGFADTGILAEKLISYANDASLLKKSQDLASGAFQMFSMQNCGTRFKEVLSEVIK